MKFGLNFVPSMENIRKLSTLPKSEPIAFAKV